MKHFAMGALALLMAAGMSGVSVWADNDNHRLEGRASWEQSRNYGQWRAEQARQRQEDQRREREARERARRESAQRTAWWNRNNNRYNDRYVSNANYEREIRVLRDRIREDQREVDRLRDRLRNDERYGANRNTYNADRDMLRRELAALREAEDMLSYYTRLAYRY